MKLLEKTFVLLFCFASATAFAAESVDIKTLFESIPEAEQLRKYSGYKSTVVSIAWSSDGKRIFSGGFDKRATLRDVESGEIVFFAHIAVAGNSVAFVPPDEVFYTGQKICIAAPDKDKENVQWHGPNVPYRGRASVRADGKVVCFAAEKELHIWDLENRKHLRSFEIEDTASVSSDLEPSGKRVIVGNKQGAVIHDAESGEVLHRLSDAHGGKVTVCAFGPNGVVATGGDDGNMIAWDAKTGEMLHCVTHLGRIVNALAFSHDGKKLAVIVHDSDGYVFDTKTWEPICRLPSRSDWNKQVAWDPTDTKLAVAQVRSIKVYKIPDGKK